MSLKLFVVESASESPAIYYSRRYEWVILDNNPVDGYAVMRCSFCSQIERLVLPVAHDEFLEFTKSVEDNHKNCNLKFDVILTDFGDYWTAECFKLNVSRRGKTKERAKEEIEEVIRDYAFTHKSEIKTIRYYTVTPESVKVID